MIATAEQLRADKVLDRPPEGWLMAARAADLTGLAMRTVQVKCQKGEYAAVRAQTIRGTSWFVDPACLPEFQILTMRLPPAPPAPSAPQAPYSSLSDAKRQTVQARLRAVQACRDAIENRPAGLGITAARRAFLVAWKQRGEQPALTERTLIRWLSAYRSSGLAGLVDERHWHGVINFSTEAIEFIEGEYLREGAQALRRIYERAEALAVNGEWQLPSYRHVCRIMKSLDPAVQACGRDPRKFRDRFLPYIERDWSKVPAMGCWIADHRVFDVLLPRQVRDKKGRAVWRWARPWLTMFMDGRSWMPVSWSISWEAPDGNRTMATFLNGVKAHGRPDHVYLDNGKDFRMALFSGGRPDKIRADYAQGRREFGSVCPEHHVRSALEILEVGCTFAIPFNAKAKTIEPFFRIQADRIDKTFDTYCGSKTERKPEALKGHLAVGAETWAVKRGLTLEAFSAAFNAWITDHYALAPSPAEAAEGLSALRAFHELRSPDFAPTRPCDEDLALVLMPSKAVCVAANGIFVPAFSSWYWSDALLDRRGASGRDARRKVSYRLDPDDPSGIFVFDEKGAFLCRATPYIGQGLHPVAPAGHADQERISAQMALRRGLEKSTKQFVRERREAAEARLAAVSPRLAASAAAARQLGRLDDAATIEEPAPVVIKISELSAAGVAMRKNGEQREPGFGIRDSEKSETAPDAESRIPNPGFVKNERAEEAGPDGVGALSASAIDLLPDEPLEADHDNDARSGCLDDDFPA